MKINITSKKPIGGFHPAVGAINSSIFPTIERSGKGLKTLRAAIAMHGHTLHWSDASDRSVRYWANLCGLTRYLPTLQDATLLLARIGERL